VNETGPDSQLAGDSGRAVFLSYASQDVAAAQRICDALRGSGIEVWFDQSELRGGDAWDRQIRKQIHECALFIPVISRNSQARLEGYFRREWKLAVDRTHDMAEGKPFLVPVVIDETTEREAEVPEPFLRAQWTSLPAGETPPPFLDLISHLLAPGSHLKTAKRTSGNTPAAAHAPPPAAMSAGWRSALLVFAALALVTLSYFVTDSVVRSKRVAEAARPPRGSTQIMQPAPSRAPENSIAVLPFVDMSEKKDQGYFADSLSEEVIDLLTKIPDLRVPARTSSFYFKGKQTTIAEIAAVLRVAHILEGSVRKAGSQVRVTAQLVRVADGYHVWSKTYDRRLDDIFKVQDEISVAVAHALRMTLVERPRSPGEVTSNPEAYDRFLRGRKIANSTGQLLNAIALLKDAVRLDPQFARAWATLSTAYLGAAEAGLGPDTATWTARARSAAETSLRIDPRLVYGHKAMAQVDQHALDWAAAERHIEAVEALDPAGAVALNMRANLDFELGDWQGAIDTAGRIIDINPLDISGPAIRAAAFSVSGRHRDAEQAYRRVLEINPQSEAIHSQIATELVLDHRPQEALAEVNLEPDADQRAAVVPLIYYAMGYRAKSDAALAAYQSKHATDDTLGIAYIYAFRGETDEAFRWIDRGYAQHDPTLFVIQGNLGAFANIHSDPRYRALLRKMNMVDESTEKSVAP